MEALLTFITALIWQFVVIGVLIAIFRTGFLQRLAKLQISPQGLTFEVQEILKRQDKLQKEVDALRFLISCFVTRWELTHLQKLADDKPYDYVWSGERNDRFIQELIRLWDFGLVARKENVKSWYNVPQTGNLRDFAEITQRGRDYLVLRQQVQPDDRDIGQQPA